MTAGAGLLVVFAQPWDPAPSALAAAWSGEIRVVTPSDLSRPGWRLCSGADARARLVAGGEVIDVADVEGIITRLGWILPTELTWIDASDREFVAAEMGAFLLAFLNRVDRPVLNRPTPLCLAGPIFQPAVWRHRARIARFPLSRAGEGAEREIPVVAGVARSVRFRPEGWAAERLASACDAGLLSVTVTGSGAFVDAHPFTDLTDPALARAAVSSFRRRMAA